jgi:maltokinase
MTLAAAFAAGDLDFVPADQLAAWLLEQRWFATKASSVSEVLIRRSIALDGERPFVLAIVEVRFPAGTHNLYQVPLGLRATGAGAEDVICTVDGFELYDALTDTTCTRWLGGLLSGAARVESDDATLEFHWIDGACAPLATATDVRVSPGEQSNTSLIYDDRVALKVFRRLQAGINPELEMLRFLSERDFAHMPQLLGWYDHRGELLEATLGVGSSFVADARDGWQLTLEALAAGRGAEWARTLAALGSATGLMHTTLGSDPSDPDFAPEPCSPETMALLIAAIDSTVEDTFLDLPDSPALAPIAGRAEEIQSYVRQAGQVGGGRLVRHHGDYHLGQAMLAGERWVIVDFEGEPARTLSERRLKRPPLRDVAGMLRSFSYAVAAAERQHAIEVPDDWEGLARASFLDAYRASVDGSLVPADPAQFERMLALFELEKSIYELRYELDHRPDWVPIPVLAIERLLAGIAS